MMRHKVTKVLHSFRWFLKLSKNAFVLHSNFFWRQRRELPPNFLEAAAHRIADEESDLASMIATLHNNEFRPCQEAMPPQRCFGCCAIAAYIRRGRRIDRVQVRCLGVNHCEPWHHRMCHITTTDQRLQVMMEAAAGGRREVQRAREDLGV